MADRRSEPAYAAEAARAVIPQAASRKPLRGRSFEGITTIHSTPLRQNIFDSTGPISLIHRRKAVDDQLSLIILLCQPPMSTKALPQSAHIE